MRLATLYKWLTDWPNEPDPMIVNGVLIVQARIRRVTGGES